MLSFWEKESFLRHDFIVAGGGMIGLSTAIALKEKHPSASVLVLERGLLPAGASTKNVGFLSVSTLSEVLADRKAFGDETLLAVIAKRHEGMRLLRERYGDAALGFEPAGGYELLMGKELPMLDRLAEVNSLLRAIFPSDVFHARADLLEPFGFNRSIVKGLVYNPFDGHVRTGMTMRSVLSYAASRGIQVMTGAEATGLDEDSTGVTVRISGGLELRAGHVVVCTSALTEKLAPGQGITPARGQAFITEPLDAVPFRGTFNFDEGYYYFRDVGKRVIVGGARHTDRETETTHETALNPGIHERLERVLAEIILPGRSVRIEDRWAGIMAFSDSRLPVVKRLSPRTAIGFGCNSMGLVMGSAIGRDTAALF